jgi:hypothetical protein
MCSAAVPWRIARDCSLAEPFTKSSSTARIADESDVWLSHAGVSDDAQTDASPRV